MAREELALLVASWTAMIAVGCRPPVATAEAQLWCAVLLTQSLPYLAAVTVAVFAAFPARQPAVSSVHSVAPLFLPQLGSD